MSRVLSEETYQRMMRAIDIVEGTHPPRRAAGMVGGQQDARKRPILDIRWNSDSKTIQVTFVSDPGESDWEDKITFGPCST